MGGYRPVTTNEIWAIASLHKVGHSVKYISENTGEWKKSVQRWVKRLCESGGKDWPHKNKPPGKPCKTHSRTLIIIKHQADKFPDIMARHTKESNLQLFRYVSVRTVQHRLHNDLAFKHFVVVKPKPLTSVSTQVPTLGCWKTEKGIVEWWGQMYGDQQHNKTSVSAPW